MIISEGFHLLDIIIVEAQELSKIPSGHMLVHSPFWYPRLSTDMVGCFDVWVCKFRIHSHSRRSQRITGTQIGGEMYLHHSLRRSIPNSLRICLHLEYGLGMASSRFPRCLAGEQTERYCHGRQQNLNMPGFNLLWGLVI